MSKDQMQNEIRYQLSKELLTRMLFRNLITEEEYNQMADAEKEKEKARIAEVYLSAGADYVIDNMSSLTALIETIEKQ